MPEPLMMYTKKQNSSSRREEQVYDDLPFTDRDHGRKCI